MEPCLAGSYVHRHDHEAPMVQEEPGEGQEEDRLHSGGCFSLWPLC